MMRRWDLRCCSSPYTRYDSSRRLAPTPQHVSKRKLFTGLHTSPAAVMHIALIWAMAENRVIGRDNALPWRLPADMRHFMNITMGKPVIMGRKTFESMKAALPGRTNIVLTQDSAWQRAGAQVCHEWPTALDLAERQCRMDGKDEVLVIGGADIYALALPVATRLYITHVHVSPVGDVFFPEFDLSGWRCLRAEHFEADHRHAAAFTIAVYERGDHDSVRVAGPPTR